MRASEDFFFDIQPKYQKYVQNINQNIIYFFDEGSRGGVYSLGEWGAHGAAEGGVACFLLGGRAKPCGMGKPLTHDRLEMSSNNDVNDSQSVYQTGSICQ